MFYMRVFSFFFFKQKTAYEMRISDWSSDVCSSDLLELGLVLAAPTLGRDVDRDFAARHHLDMQNGGRVILRIDPPERRIGEDRRPQRVLRMAIGSPHPLIDHLLERLAALQPAILPPFTENRSEEHTSAPQSLMRISYAVFSL